MIDFPGACHREIVGLVTLHGAYASFTSRNVPDSHSLVEPTRDQQVRVWVVTNTEYEVGMAMQYLDSTSLW